MDNQTVEEVKTTEESVAETHKEEIPDTTVSSSLQPEKERLTPEQQEIYDLMASDKKFVAIHDIMQVKNKLNEISTVKEYALEQVKSMIPDDRISLLEARAVALDKESLINLDMEKDADWEKVKAVYTFEDGGMIHFTNDPDTKIKKVREMHRDYLIYLRDIKEETAKFEIIEKESKETLDKLYKELDEVLGEAESAKIKQYSAFADYYRDWIMESLKREDLSDQLREQLQKTLDADNRGINLEFLKKEIRELISRKGNADSLRYGYRNNFVETARKATAVLASKFSRYNYHLSLTKFYDLEKRLFPDKYGEKFNNLFMFIIFRFIKANCGKFDKFWMITIGEVVTQLGFLFRDESERPESSKEFVKNFQEVMDLVVNH